MIFFQSFLTAFSLYAQQIKDAFAIYFAVNLTMLFVSDLLSVTGRFPGEGIIYSDQSTVSDSLPKTFQLLHNDISKLIESKLLSKFSPRDGKCPAILEWELCVFLWKFTCVFRKWHFCHLTIFCTNCKRCVCFAILQYLQSNTDLVNSNDDILNQSLDAENERTEISYRIRFRVM